MDTGNSLVQRTLVVIKPDAVKRGLIGEIIQRLERTGLKLVGMKMVEPTDEQLDQHFRHNDPQWILTMGSRTLESYNEIGVDVKEHFDTDDPQEIGQTIYQYNRDLYHSGPVVAIVLQGPRAVELVRKMIGHTIPFKAAPGTIRVDFSGMTSEYPNSRTMTAYHVIHAS